MAELGAAFLCAALGVASEIREDHASYLAHWLTIMTADKRANFTAASQAQKAADYLHGLHLDILCLKNLSPNQATDQFYPLVAFGASPRELMRDFIRSRPNPHRNGLIKS